MELVRGNNWIVMEVLEDKWSYFQEWWGRMLSISDKRVENWFLMDAYMPTLLLSALYLFIVYAGRRVMATREPFNFKYTLTLYNLGLVALNFHIFYELLTCSYRLNYSYLCQPVNYDPNNEDEIRIAKALWWYYFSKLLEFMDTIFFVLRKKNNQISFLHLYHHASMFPIWWIGVKWTAGGQAFFGAMINSFIHVLMYSYYGISALGKEYQKYLWWKRYLTVLQLIQFVMGMTHAAGSLFVDCNFPKWMCWSLVVYGATILGLFLNFYFHSYIKKSVKQAGKYATEQGKSQLKTERNGHALDTNANGDVKDRSETKKRK